MKEAAFPAEIYAEPLRTSPSMLCYDQDVLPQGAPRSPWIANLVLRPFDEKLGACAGRGWCIPATATDLAFSGTAGLGVEERAEDVRGGPGLNRAKRDAVPGRPAERVHRPGGPTNGWPSPPAAAALRQELYFCRRRVQRRTRAVGWPGGGGEQCLRRLLGQVDLRSRPSRTGGRLGGVTAVVCWTRCGMGVKRGGHICNGCS